eukprot:gene10897-14627_t
MYLKEVFLKKPLLLPDLEEQSNSSIVPCHLNTYLQFCSIVSNRNPSKTSNMFRALVVFASLLSVMGFSSIRPARVSLSKDSDAADFAFKREAELKHGRVAMLAVLGYIVQEYGRWPGALDGSITFSSIPNGVGAVGVVPSLGWLQIIASIGYWELIGWEDNRVAGSAGDFNWGTSFKGRPNTDKETADYKLKELQNGRLAMLAILELTTHDIAKPAGEGLFVLHHF